MMLTAHDTELDFFITATSVLAQSRSHLIAKFLYEIKVFGFLSKARCQLIGWKIIHFGSDLIKARSSSTVIFCPRIFFYP